MTDVNVNLAAVNGSGAALFGNIEVDKTLGAVSGTGSAQASIGNPQIPLASAIAGTSAASLGNSATFTLGAASGTGSALPLPVAARIIGIASFGTMRSILPVDAVLTNTPVPSNGNMSTNPVPAIGTLLVA